MVSESRKQLQGVLRWLKVRRSRLASWVEWNIHNLLRLGVVTVFFGLAVWAVYLSFRWGEGAWIIRNTEWGRFLAFGLITVGPELAGIFIGLVTIDYLSERRQERMFKEQLINQMRSKHNDVTDTAVRILGGRRWLYDGSLRKAILANANLRGAEMWGADLQGAVLMETNLEYADLRETNLVGAVLTAAKLSHANLWRANLKDADLRGSDLRSANLWDADLEGADLTGAILIGAYLSITRMTDITEGWAMHHAIERLGKARSVEGAYMPDGVRLRTERGMPGFNVPPYPAGPTFEEWVQRYTGVTEPTDWGAVEAELNQVLNGEEE